MTLGDGHEKNYEKDIPFGASADAIFNDLGFLDRADLFEEGHEVLRAQTSCKLLHKDSSTITFIFIKFGGLFLTAGRGSTALITAATGTTIIIAVTTARAVVAIIVGRAGARAHPTSAAVKITTRAVIITATTTVRFTATTPLSAPLASMGTSMLASWAGHLFIGIVSVGASAVTAAVTVVAATSITRTITAIVIGVCAALTLILFGRSLGGCGGGRLKKSLNIECGHDLSTTIEKLFGGSWITRASKIRLEAEDGFGFRAWVC